jgi:DNA-binding GntR family transcriptional regulator
MLDTPPEDAPQLDLPLSEQAYRFIRQEILLGRIAPGAKLKIDALQRDYGISNTPLREALSRLAAELLVIADNRRGFRATPISLNDFRDLTKARLIVEIGALQASIDAGTDKWEANILGAFHRMEVAQGRAGRDPSNSNDEWTRRHKEFHMTLVAASGSDRLLTTCSAMFDQAERYRRISTLHRKHPRDARSEHRRLKDLTISRDKVAAASLLREHIIKTADHVAQIMSELRQ